MSPFKLAQSRGLVCPSSAQYVTSTRVHLKGVAGKGKKGCGFCGFLLLPYSTPVVEVALRIRSLCAFQFHKVGEIWGHKRSVRQIGSEYRVMIRVH